MLAPMCLDYRYYVLPQHNKRTTSAFTKWLQICIYRKGVISRSYFYFLMLPSLPPMVAWVVEGQAGP